VLACYRRHRSAETARLEAAGETTADMISAIAALSMHLPAARRAVLQRRAYRRLARSCTRRAAKLIDAGSRDAAAKQLECAQSALALLPEDLTTRWLRSRLVRLEPRLPRRASRTGT
jgi:hypothetical protein